MEVYIKNFIIAILLAISTFLGSSGIRSIKNETRITNIEKSLLKQEDKLDKIYEILVKRDGE